MCNFEIYDGKLLIRLKTSLKDGKLYVETFDKRLIKDKITRPNHMLNMFGADLKCVIMRVVCVYTRRNEI